LQQAGQTNVQSNFFAKRASLQQNGNAELIRRGSSLAAFEAPTAGNDANFKPAKPNKIYTKTMLQRHRSMLAANKKRGPVESSGQNTERALPRVR